ncbi:MAG: lysine--tRNA ligase [Bacteroidota bacterium]
MTRFILHSSFLMLHSQKMKLTEQEIVRRDNLQKIKELGVDPYPPELYPVDFYSNEITTAVFHENLKKMLAAIKGIGSAGAEKLLPLVLKNRYKAEGLLKNEETVAEFNLSEDIVFDEGANRSESTLSEYLLAIKGEGLGEFNKKQVCLAGRFMGQRGPFAKLQDSQSQIQLFLGKGKFGETEEEQERNKKLIKLLDIGDYIGVKGYIFSTGTGEVSVHVEELKFLAKSLKTLPIVKRDKEGNVYDEFKDPELRYRMRYVDLVVNPKVKETFLKRSKMVASIRSFLNDRGALEVDTPVLQAIPGGAAARPFITHHNALDVPFYLRIANELYLKRLIVGGFDWVYEFSRNFRNEGMDRTHNPEFTVLEFYTAYKDYFWMMETTEQMLEKMAIDTCGATDVTVGENTISFKAPFQRIGILDAIKEHTGFDVHGMDEAGLREVCKKLHLEIDDSMGKGKLIDEIFGEKCEHHYIQPTFITDYPVEMSPLTKRHRDKPGLVERFELMVNGKEVANAYTELNDPIEQRERFEEQSRLMDRGDDEAMYIDHDFLRAMEYGMPPMSGIGFGIDRLAMLFTNQSSIQEVLFFPQMRPEKF